MKPLRNPRRHRRLSLSTWLLLIFLGLSLYQYAKDQQVNWVTDSFRSIHRFVSTYTSSGSGLAQQAPGSYSVQLSATVVKIHDGDSFSVKVDGALEEIRLFGIDAPEWKQASGPEAREALQQLLTGRTLTLDVIETDSYQRLVTIAHSGKDNINLRMIRLGHAWWYRRYAPDNLAFRDAERAARDAGIGLWQQTSPMEPWRWRELHR